MAGPSKSDLGSFLNEKSETILVSAAHVLKELTQRELFYYIAPTLIRRLSGRLILELISKIILERPYVVAWLPAVLIYCL